jgi:hypothetical protein
MLPHSGVGGCAPMPMKLKLAAVRIANPTPSVATTMTYEQRACSA